MKAKHLTKQDFLEKIANYEVSPDKWEFLGTLPAIVDFYAGWCVPCKMLGLTLDELSEEYAGKVDIYKVNVEEEEELSALFGIRSVPTMLFIPMAGKPQLATGALSKSELKNVIENILLKK